MAQWEATCLRVPGTPVFLSCKVGASVGVSLNPLFGVLVSVGDYEVSPTPPITVTHKPEEDTFGVSPVLFSPELLCMYFSLMTAQYLQTSAVLRCLQGKISSFVIQDNRQSEGFYGLCRASKVLMWTMWASWVCSVEPGSPLKIRHPVKLLLAGQKFLLWESSTQRTNKQPSVCFILLSNC